MVLRPRALILHLNPLNNPDRCTQRKDADSAASTSPSVSKAKASLTAAPKLATTVIVNAPNPAIDQAKEARDHPHDVTLGGGGLSPQQQVDDESKHAAEALDEEAAQLPEGVYGKDAALNMAEYHNAEATGDESDELARHQGMNAKDSPHHKADRESSQPFPSSSSPPSTSHLPLLDTRYPYVRGGSAAPDVQVTIPNAGKCRHRCRIIHRVGAFPTRSPAGPTFNDAVVNVGPSYLGQAVTTAEDVARLRLRGSEHHLRPRGNKSSSAFGQGGQAFPDETERDLFWVSIEGKHFSFQLGSCDNDEGQRRFDDLESATMRWWKMRGC